MPRRVPDITPLERERRRAGLTQTELARQASVSRQRVSLAEGGARISDETWRKLAKALDVDIERIKPPG